MHYDYDKYVTKLQMTKLVKKNAAEIRDASRVKMSHLDPCSLPWLMSACENEAQRSALTSIWGL